MTTPPTATPDRERLVDAEHVLHGPDGAGAVRRVLYAVYVGAILSVTYGFTVARAVLLTSDVQWVRDVLLSVPAAVGALVAAALLVAVAHGVGRRRGPVVPPLPWVDHVVASSLDRSVALREWWVVSGTLVLAAATVVGAVLGGSLWAAEATGPAALVAGVVSGVVLGAALALAWLAGQVGAEGRGVAGRPAATLGRPARSLRRLTLDGLRTQSVRSSHLGGAVLAGDLRAARLEVATPVRRARHVRLRSHGPFLTVAARDLLGLRRQPALLVGGLVLVAPGAAGVAWSLGDPQVPALLAVVAVALLHLGTGIWAEGGRLLGDTMGTPRLSGLELRTEAAAHAVVPGTLLLLTSLVAGVAVQLAVAAPATSAPFALLWLVLTGLLVLGSTGVSAFRGRPPRPAFSTGGGPFHLLSWYGRPVAAAALAGGLLTSAAADAAVPEVFASWLALAAAAAGWWATHGLARAFSAHRD